MYVLSIRTYDTMLNGGTCFDHGQLIDPNLEKKSLLNNLFTLYMYNTLYIYLN